jgi:hypothetical protein
VDMDEQGDQGARQGWADPEEGIPGHYELSLVVFRVDQVPSELQDAGLALEGMSYTYERLRERLGGDEGVLIDPRGEEHAVSLKQWTGRSTRDLRFAYQFRFFPNREYEGEHQRRLRDYLHQRGQTIPDEAS